MSIKANIFDTIETKASFTSNTLYKIKNDITFTNSQTKEVSITYEINKEILKPNSFFKVGQVGYVYKLNGLHYEAWDWWRDHHAIDENYFVYFSNYVVCEPFTTIIYNDGSFVS